MKLLLGFTFAYTVGLLAYGLVVDSPLALLYTGITILLFVVFGVIHRYAHFEMPVLWGISLVGLGNMLGGVLLVDGQPLYMSELLGTLRYDKVFHAVAAAAMVPVAWSAMKHWAGEGFHRGGALFLTFLIVMGGGAVVEIAEFIGSTMSNVSVGDYGNNALDLVANAAGAAVGLGVVWWWEQGRSGTPTG